MRSNFFLLSLVVAVSVSEKEMRKAFLPLPILTAAVLFSGSYIVFVTLEFVLSIIFPFFCLGLNWVFVLSVEGLIANLL